MNGLRAILIQPATVPQSITDRITALETDVAALETLTSALPLGEVGYAEKTANQGPITTIVDVSGLSVTWTASSDREYLLTATSFVLGSTLDDIVNLSITDSSNNPVNSSQIRIATTGSIKATAEARITGVSGSVTYKVRAAVVAGAGNCTIAAGAGFPAFLLVEDMGA